MCEQLDDPLLASPARMVHALLAAVRGNEDQAQELADQLLRWAAPRESAGPVSRVARTRSGCAGPGDFEHAYQQLTMISPAGELALYVPYAMHVSMDLVEAAVRTGRDARGGCPRHRAAPSRIAELSPRLAMLVSGQPPLPPPAPTQSGSSSRH